MSPATRAVLVTQWYPPEPVVQPATIAHALHRRGLAVEVLTGIPNYPSGRVPEGYRAFRSRSEVIAGLSVRRTPLYPSHDSSSARRFLTYASWALSSALLGQRTLRRADAVLVYSSPATSALPALVARRLWGTPYVLLVQDVWPDSIFASGFMAGRFRPVIEGLVGRVVDRFYLGAAAIAVISPGMVDLLAGRGVPADKLHVVYNWVDVADGPSDDGRSTWRRQLGLDDDDFVVLYAGNHGAAQALDCAVDAFAGLGSQDRAHLVMVGDGVAKQRLVRRAQTAATERVHFVEPQPRAEMTALMAAADAQLVSLADRPLFAVTTPSKLQAMLAAGQPVVASAAGDVADVVNRSGAGITATPEDADALRAAVRSLQNLSGDELAAMGRRGQALYDSEMSEAVGAARLVDLLRQVATDRPVRRRVGSRASRQKRMGG